MEVLSNLELYDSEGYIKVIGGNIWYKIVGKEKKGVPLIVIHGGPGATHDYLEPLENLSDQMPVIFYDQLGSGKSDKPDDKSLWKIERFVDELKTLIGFFNLKEFSLFGSSWGTTLAVEYLLTEKPEGIRKLVMSGPCLSVSAWTKDQENYIKELPEDLQKVIMESEEKGVFGEDYQMAIDEFYKRHLFLLSEYPDYLKRTFENMATEPYNVMWGQSEFTMTGNLRGFERVEKLKEIKASAIFICGRYDEASPETTEYYHKNYPGSEFYIIEEASHMHHIEKEEEFIGVVRAFLSK